MRVIVCVQGKLPTTSHIHIERERRSFHIIISIFNIVCGDGKRGWGVEGKGQDKMVRKRVKKS